MSGLLALLDDVAAIAKVASASLDDITGQAVKASSKAAGAVIDDTAVTPKYVDGFSADREIPIVLRIARGSLFNKLVILLPVALVLSTFAPWAIAPLLMIGGAYLCFEGAEKVWHAFFSRHEEPELHQEKPGAARLEERKVKGAIKTDFILSAEIMTIILAALPAHMGIGAEAAALAIAGAIVTAGVYGAVALLVKADDLGVVMAAKGYLRLTRSLGRGIVKGMPAVMRLLLVIGTAAMIWVGGSIVLHGAYEVGLTAPYLAIEDIAASVAQMAPFAHRAIEWLVAATIDGIFGLALGLLLIPVAKFAVAPLLGLLPRKATSR